MVSANHEVMKLTYLQYRTYLENFQSKWSSFSAASNGRTGNSDKPKFRPSRWKGVNHAGPSRYGRRPIFRASTKKLTCFNCGEEGCRVKTCKRQTCKRQLELQRIAQIFAKFRETKTETHFTEAFFALAEILVTAGHDENLTVNSESQPECDTENSEEDPEQRPHKRVGFIDEDPAINLLDDVALETLKSAEAD